ncbi:MAG: hypothetical protein IJK83_07645 [Clostridiales bacterium]|nr:hypothetical protein [Clostridiales bacterium]
MLAVIYLVFCAAFGMCFVGLSVPDIRRLYVACSPAAKSIAHIPNTLFTVPAGIVTGLMCVPFFNYYVTLGLSYLLDNGELCKKLGVLITFVFFLWMILTCLILINRKRVKREALRESGATMIDDYKFNILDSIFYGAVILAITVAATFLMFYTYRINGNNLMNGYSTFSDLSPHTAMVSSFGKGFNFPTQYNHFSGDGIKYHFLFYFLAGTLEYLGLPIDYALNFPSIITMVCALVLLGLLAVLISSRRAAFLVAPVLVFFRSSLNVFFHIKELMVAGATPVQAIKDILAFREWYEVTPYDAWGIWAINVYPNQRHLMLGVSVILILIILFLPFVRRLGISLSRADGFGNGVKTFAFSRNAWITRSQDPLYPLSIVLLASVLVIVMPYFHGSCLIALLLVLFGMAIFSESRLLYLIVAICGVVSSYIQTLVFSGGYKNVVSFMFEPGFILGKEVTATELVRYIVIVTGLTLILALVFAVTSLVSDLAHKKPVYRFLLFICFLNPMIFAFLCKVSLEMLANHKFIQVTLILVDAFVAALIANLLYIPLKIRKAGAEPEEAASENDIIEASADDSEIAVATASDDKGIRTPVLSTESAFGEALPAEEKSEDKPDIEALDSHTGIDADINDISNKLPEEIRPDNAEENQEAPSDDISDLIVEEEITSDLLFGDGSGSEKNEEEDEEAKAGVAAIAALFGEDIEEKNKTEEEKPEEKASEPVSEENVDDGTADEMFEVIDSDDSDDSDQALMASASESAHVSMRPGSVALGLAFGEETPDEADSNAAEEPSQTEPSAEEIKPEALKHEPVKTKKAKGIPLPAWIALEIAGVILAVALMLPLTATGVSEWATYINLNSTPMSLNVDSPVTKWIIENTDPQDVFLTPQWSMNRFLLAGRPMYFGWPYYAWSAGHDTYTRNTIYLWLISGCGGDINEFTRYCKERHIKYLIVEPEFINGEFENGVTFNKEFFEQNLSQAAHFAEEDTTIYRIY